MNKTLVIIDSTYPFDKGEPFMENEVPFLNGFDKVLICPCSVCDFNRKREIDNNLVSVYPIHHDKKAIKLLKYIKMLFCKQTIKEIYFLLRHKNLNKSTIKSLLSFIYQGQIAFKRIKKHLINNGIKKTDNIFFYSYWLHFHAYTALLLKKTLHNSKAISRCHGYDLYEYRNFNNYIPLRKFILENLDTIFSISTDGKNYLEKKYPNYKKNILISRLGTMDNGIRKVDITRNPFKIVSCSWVVPVKRVNRIIDALSKIKDIDIDWTHFGDGELFKDIKKYAQKLLPSNIKFNLNGAISNQELHQQYLNNDYDIFINVSESEGIPVSIMEAISFGIPVIATDVGGVNEIVFDNKNGNLLDKDFTDEQLIESINKFALMPNEEYLRFRKAARKIWENMYNAQKNYGDFLNKINMM